jgi:hypothetical protein
MSTQIANISLVGAVVGVTTGTIPLGRSIPPPTIAQQMRPQQTAGSTLFVWNESGCGLSCLFPLSGESFTLPAGQWRQLQVPPGEESLLYVVSYILPNAPISLLLADLYLPGEPIDPMGVLGNSPIGLSGAVPVSVSSVANDGNPVPTTFVESTPQGGIQTTNITNDGHIALTPNNPNTATDIAIAVSEQNAPETQARDAVVLLGRKTGDASSRLSLRMRGSDGYGSLGLAGPNGANPTNLFAQVNGLNIDTDVALLGNLAKVGGLGTLGRGVPIIQQRPLGFNIPNSTNTFVASINMPAADTPVIIFASFLVNTGNTNSGIITLKAGYTDAASNVSVSAFLALYPGATALSAVTIARAASYYNTYSVMIVAKASTNVNIQYQNTAAGTINDFVTGAIVLL